MEYYRVQIYLDKKSLFFIWCGNDDEKRDSFYIPQDGITNWNSFNERDLAAKRNGIILSDEDNREAYYDFDKIQNWIDLFVKGVENTFTIKTLEMMLNAWNIFIDFAEAFSEEGKAFNKIADKNLHVHDMLSEIVLSPIIFEKEAVPSRFTEKTTLSKVLGVGIEMYRAIINVNKINQ